jgi:hypothetical protein
MSRLVYGQVCKRSETGIGAGVARDSEAKEDRS